MSMTRAEIERRFYAPGAKWRGDEYWTLNPFRKDNTIHSFSIREDGVYYDFATGDKGVIRDEVLQTEEYFSPSDVGRIVGTYVTPYTINGNIAFVVVRKDLGNDKVIYPLQKKNGKICKGIPAWCNERPLMVPHRNDVPLLIVEGEKCYHKALLFIKMNNIPLAVTTWHGGANIVNKISFKNIEGHKDKRAILWPDNDDVGRNAMYSIARKLIAMEYKVCFVDTPGAPEGWDIADAIDQKSVVEIVQILKGATKRVFDTVEQLDLVYNPVKEKEGTKKERMAYPMTDLGNAERFADMWRGKVIYNTDKQKWLVWNGKIWEHNPAELSKIIKKTIEACYEDFQDEASKNERLEKINNMLKLASALSGMYAAETDFDSDPFVIVCENGVIDLKAGTLLPHDPRRLVSRMVHLEYKSTAKADLFYKFLDDITLGRQEIQEFLQRWFGLCLSGDTSPQVFTIFYGTGANGKSTLTDVIHHILGEYSAVAPSTTLIEQKNSTIPNDLAGMRAARVVFASETGAEARLDEGKVKSMTGGDIISARFMRGEFFKFKPVWKIVLSTNHKPKIVNNDYGIWRRIILVPFDYRVDKSKADPFLAEKLKQEAEGIFAWMVEGARQYFAEGSGRAALKIPQVVEQETQEYREEEDNLAQFIAQYCIVEEELASKGYPDRITGTLLHKFFIKWAKEVNNGFLEKVSLQKFYKMLRDHGFQVQRAHGNTTFVKGIYVRREYMEDDQQ